MNDFNYALKNMRELNQSEYYDLNGGLVFMTAYAIGSTALVAYGAFMAGYDAACNQ